MAFSTIWDAIDPLSSGHASTPASTDVTVGGLGQAAVNSRPAVAHPDHPFFWFAVVAGVTVGLVGASTHLRVGPFRVSGSAGRS